jgi:uncharacterized integral membrane protein
MTRNDVGSWSLTLLVALLLTMLVVMNYETVKEVVTIFFTWHFPR